MRLRLKLCYTNLWTIMYRNSKYIQYFSLGEGAYLEKIQYYESIYPELKFLYTEERIEMDIDYIFCLSEIGLYHKLLQKVDPIIELVIIENIYDINGEDIYTQLLFKKAICLYHVGQYTSAIHILQQLKAIDHKNKLYQEVILLSFKKLHSKKILLLHIMVYASLATVFCIAVMQLFYRDNIFSQHQNLLFQLRWTLLLFSITLMVGIEVYLRIFSKYKTIKKI